MRELLRRITNLEEVSKSEGVACCFVDPGETPDTAVARHWPEGLPPNVKLMVFSWEHSREQMQ